MVSSGTVSSDASSFSSIMSQYSSDISGIGGTWEGESHDNFMQKAEAFQEEYSSQIPSQMESFANACELFNAYLEEKKAKEKYQSLDGTKKGTAADGSDIIWDCKDAIKECEAELERIKKEIDSALSSASKVSLTATDTSVSADGGKDTGSKDVKGDSDNQTTSTGLVTSSKSGYTFPLANGVEYEVSSGVGPRWGSTHRGTDIAVPEGTEVHSLSSGTVLHAGPADGYGQWVQIQQDDGYIVTYGHVSKYDYFQEGDRVNAGDVVALSGNEGDSTGPHLHLQIEDSNGDIYDSEDIMSDVYK